MEKMVTDYTYDEIYMNMWETAQRYYSFANFRVIGNSHDERMIPMLEIGTGPKVLFCISGMTGNEKLCVNTLMKMIDEYCKFYERKWEMDKLYSIRELLSKVRLCIIPLANPDGYEIYRKGYLAIRNPILRQMLRMRNIPHCEYEGNGRNVSIKEDFPLLEEYLEYKYANEYSENEKLYMERYTIENETKSLIHIFQEYDSVGMIVFSNSGGRIVQYKFQPKWNNGRDRRIAGQLKKLMNYRIESRKISMYGEGSERRTKGDCGQYYAKFIRKPAFRIDFPMKEDENERTEDKNLECYEALKTIPLEFIFSL